MALPGFGAPPADTTGMMPPALSALAPAPMVPPPPPPEIEAANAKLAEIAKGLIDVMTLYSKALPGHPVLGMLEQTLKMLTMLPQIVARQFPPPIMRMPDGTAGPRLDREPAGGVGVGNPAMVLQSILGRG